MVTTYKPKKPPKIMPPSQTILVILKKDYPIGAQIKDIAKAIKLACPDIFKIQPSFPSVRMAKFKEDEIVYDIETAAVITAPINIAYGYCHCGCGSLTSIAKKTNTRLGHIQGQPVRFIPGHQFRRGERKGENHPLWKGGKTTNSNGYVWIKNHNHPNSDKKGYVSEHYLVAEKALEKALPKKSCIHHVDEIRDHNDGHNLVICQDRGYHNLLHSRMKALKNCGHVNWVRCQICHKYDHPQNLYIYPRRNQGYHKECKSKRMKEQYLDQKKEIRCNG